MYSAVIGLGFGDEGKGITTDYLCSRVKNPLVCRYSGGQQAGHNVVLNGVNHVFSNFGSGTLRGVPTYWSEFCTVEPIGLMIEYEKLTGYGITPILYIDGNSPVTTPYDIFANRVNIDTSSHGTCAVGVGQTFKREDAFYSLTFSDLFNDFILTTKIKNIGDYYKKHYNIDNISLKRFYDSIALIRHVSETTANITSINTRWKNWLFEKSKYSESYDVIFEGSQGLLLDQHYGFFPHVTRSNTGTKNILTLTDEVDLYLVTRAYQTRHGNGPMTNENLPHNISLDPNETNVSNEYQGNFRRTLLDLDLLLYGIEKDKYICENLYNSALVITCLDHIKLDYRYTYEGKIVYCSDENEFISSIKDIIKIRQVITSHSPESKNYESFKIS